MTEVEKTDKMTSEETTSSTKNDATSLEEKIYKVCLSSEVGITDEILQLAIQDSTSGERVKALNSLMAQAKVRVFQQSIKKGLIYKAVKPSLINQKITDAENDMEKLVYQLVAKSENKGIWVRDIRFQSNLSLTLVNKTLKSLVSKKIIKVIKPVNASKKKVYMLYDMEPDQSVTGGSWYSDQYFESEFITVLNQQCYRYLQQSVRAAKDKHLDIFAERNASYKSCEEVWQYITDSKISKVTLSLSDIETILDSLIYDGKIEKTTSTNSRGECHSLYRAFSQPFQMAPIMNVPCGVCPVKKDCKIGGEISPVKCVYLNDWIKF